eukprot:TRINITY_DN57239_c0_g1_i1.p1 TRINITY_DN57239_c0_g1~~TRINITY_DN57239_c0_g1_i1.p1  ORF type:complete len:345 (-),score=47.98 TRINITY_DN57239_c0_g1_i1:147-1181(-)
MATIPKSTKAIVVEKAGEVTLKEVDLPSMGADQVLVKIYGAAVNPADTYMCQGTYTNQPQMPFTPGMEGSGCVVAMGDAVKSCSLGDRIAFTVASSDGGIAATSGTWSQYCVVNALLLWRVPDSIDLPIAAALPTAFLTAHRALFHTAAIQPHESVLVRGASGAVGQAALRLARHFGAPNRLVVGTASTEDGRAAIRQAQALASGHAEADIESASAGTQFDVILDAMSNQNLGSDLSLLAPGGRVAIIGSRPGAGLASVDARLILVKEAIVRGVFLWRMTPAERRAAYVDITKALFGEECPMPTKMFDLEDAQEAFHTVSRQASGAGATQGKVILRPKQDGSRL